MTVPSQGAMHRPLLEIAAETGETWSRALIFDALVERLALTEEDLSERTPSGANRARVNSAFAVSTLARAGLLYKPSRAQYRITSEGRQFLSCHEGPIRFGTLSALINKRKPDNDDPEPPCDDDSPQDRIDAGYRELQNQLTEEVLESISQISPDAFERLVVDLLQKMGYGKGQVMGKSGDGGIDGIINQDALGLEKVYIQAKRWQSQVGEPEIRNFSGSLDAKGASNGVFVTTSSFSESAQKTAITISAGSKFIRLIAGRELVRLMLDYDVGVITTFTYKIQSLDENYFSEER